MSATEHPHDLVEVISNETEQPAVVGRSWLERWPDDYRLATDPAPVAKAEEQPSDKWSVKKLTEFANGNGIALGDARAKADILAVITDPNNSRLATEPAPAGAPEPAPAQENTGSVDEPIPSEEQ